ncbi:MAG TPA: NAD-dependent epimerase/dehydratase family protein [Anaerolineales bacterium]|nr:NAD-dependent epimerase/dehydratase family protein [Anaerolineales bacterium]
MNIVLAGGTGALGRVLTELLIAKGHTLTILSRQPENGQSDCEFVQWDGFLIGGWTRVLAGADVVINLAGKSVNCRYHHKNRQTLRDSRIFSTLALGKRRHKICWGSDLILPVKQCYTNSYA